MVIVSGEEGGRYFDILNFPKEKMKTENMSLTVNGPYEKKVPLPDDFVIDINISDMILTPFVCSSLVNEILKGILYQRCQIPYPYTWLKSVIDKKRNQPLGQEGTKPINFTIANHFRVVSSAYDCLENVMKGITKEFSENGNHIKEVVFVFGVTPQCPREVFTIKISSLAKGHLERNHASHIDKYQQKILRNIFLSQSWMDAIDASATCTNTYIFLKKYMSDEHSGNIDNSDNFFVPSKPLSFPTKLKHVKIKLDYNNSEDFNCCSRLSVFEDATGRDVFLRNEQLGNNECEKSVRWYQSKDLLKGFKDCYVNKVSACELW